MPPAQRRQPIAVVRQLLDDPHRHEFFQAVRLLERWFSQQEQLTPNEVWSTRLRFRNSLSLSFAPSEIAALTVRPRPDEPAQNDEAAREGFERASLVEQIEMTPAFMGLLGVNGTLPMFYTETLAHRELYQRDSAARAFLDIFQHRAVVLFYQAWRKHRLPLQFEQDRRRHFLPQVLSLAGVGQPALRARLKADEGGVADDALAHYAGLLQQRPMSATLIGRVLTRYFRVPVAVEQFIGRWFTLPEGSQTSLGLGCAQLGQGAVVGERVWQRDLRLRLTLGPMPHDRFTRFLPGGTGAKALRELLTLFTGVSLEYEVRLKLLASDVRPAVLVDTLPEGQGAGPRLGWDAFLVTKPSASDRDEPGYDLHSLA